MSVQTPIFVSDNISSIEAQQGRSCSVVDATGNIYTTIRATQTSGGSNYGAIQKTTTSNVTSVFLQLNSTNTPGAQSQIPTGMCFDASGYLYYIIFGNNTINGPGIYKITNFVTPDPTLVTTNNTGAPAQPSRIIIDNRIGYDNIFYISSAQNTSSGYTIKSYDTNTNLYSVVFTLPNSSASASYGLAQDPITGSNLYIGITAGQIYKGVLSTGFTSLWLTLPNTTGYVSGLVFIDNNTLFANTNAGYGYIIYIDPSTGVGTPQLYYNDTTTTIIGGLGVNSQVTYLYGMSATQLWKVYGTNTILTGYRFSYNSVQTDFAGVFDRSAPGDVTTGYTSSAYDGLDLGKIFTPTTGGTITTSYTYLTNIDLGTIFSTTVPSGIPFSFTGSDSGVVSPAVYNNTFGGYFVYYWQGSGTITLNFFPSSNIIFYVMGGGGGGSAGLAIDNAPYPYGGGGGAAGGYFNGSLSSLVSSPGTIISITVGLGGSGGIGPTGGFGGAGGNSTVSISGLNYTITCNGGSRGEYANNSPIYAEGGQANYIGSFSSVTTVTGGNGGTGGSLGSLGGTVNSSNGSANTISSITIASTSYTIGGGGGGGNYVNPTPTRYGQAGSGGNGSGGSRGSGTIVSPNTPSATYCTGTPPTLAATQPTPPSFSNLQTYGGGGGGGGSYYGSMPPQYINNVNGGAGSPGFVAIFIPYTSYTSIIPKS